MSTSAEATASTVKTTASTMDAAKAVGGAGAVAAAGAGGKGLIDAGTRRGVAVVTAVILWAITGRCLRDMTDARPTAVELMRFPAGIGAAIDLAIMAGEHVIASAGRDAHWRKRSASGRKPSGVAITGIDVVPAGIMVRTGHSR